MSTKKQVLERIQANYSAAYFHADDVARDLRLPRLAVKDILRELTRERVLKFSGHKFKLRGQA